MREIKYRALHQNGDHYREIQFIDFANRRYKFYETDYWCEGINGEWPEGREPQQYTGLKDKHGVEIYEGDVLTPEAYKNWDKEEFRCEVEFKSGMFCFALSKPFIVDKRPLYQSLAKATKAGNSFEVIPQGTEEK